MKRLNIGEMVRLNKDISCTAILSDTEVAIKKGTEMFVTAGPPHFFKTFSGKEIEIDPNHTEVTSGFSVNGIAEWLYRHLAYEFPIKDMLEDNDLDKEEFKRCIADALEELGMYDHTGNRS